MLVILAGVVWFFFGCESIDAVACIPEGERYSARASVKGKKRRKKKPGYDMTASWVACRESGGWAWFGMWEDVDCIEKQVLKRHGRSSLDDKSTSVDEWALISTSL